MSNKIFFGAGVNTFEGVQENERLSGCVNDVIDWLTLLKGFGFTQLDNYQEVFDDRATYNRVKNGFKALLDNIQDENDVGVFLFSGHGTFSAGDIRPYDEIDEFDEAIRVYDDLIIDDTFRGLIDNSNHQGKLICIFDSCYSASMLDYPHAEPMIDLINGGNSIHTGVRKKALKFRIPQNTTVARYPSRNQFYQRIKEREILISASASLGLAKEDKIGAEGQSNGVFTKFAIDVIKEAPNISYNTFITKVRERISDKYQQRPEAYSGDQNDDILFENIFT